MLRVGVPPEQLILFSVKNIAVFRHYSVHLYVYRYTPVPCTLHNDFKCPSIGSVNAEFVNKLKVTVTLYLCWHWQELHVQL